jgi:hypothetical protein
MKPSTMIFTAVLAGMVGAFGTNLFTQRAHAAELHKVAIEAAELQKAQLAQAAQTALQVSEASAAQLAQMAAVAQEVSSSMRALDKTNLAEETRAFTVTTATQALKPSSNAAFQAYQCTTTASTAATGIYVVTAGTATATTTNGYGPYCSDTAECPLGGTITADSKAVAVQAASGSQSLRCRFGLTPPN